MSRSYSTDLRIRVIEAISGGLIEAPGGGSFWHRGFDGGNVVSALSRDGRGFRARKQGQPGGSKLDVHEAFILALVRERPDISLAEIAECLAEKRAVSACPATIWYFFDRRGISFKKNRARRRARAA